MQFSIIEVANFANFTGNCSGIPTISYNFDELYELMLSIALGYIDKHFMAQIDNQSMFCAAHKRRTVVKE